MTYVMPTATIRFTMSTASIPVLISSTIAIPALTTSTDAVPTPAMDSAAALTVTVATSTQSARVRAAPVRRKKQSYLVNIDYLSHQWIRE